MANNCFFLFFCIVLYCVVLSTVLRVCQVLGRPFFALKSITDIVDGSLDSEEEFYANLALASGSLQEKLTLVVTHLGGTALSLTASGNGSASGSNSSGATATSSSSSSDVQRSSSVSGDRGVAAATALIHNAGDSASSVSVPVPCGPKQGKKKNLHQDNQDNTHGDDESGVISVSARKGIPSSSSTPLTPAPAPAPYTLFGVSKGFLQGLSFALVVGACGSWGMLLYNKSKTK